MVALVAFGCCATDASAAEALWRRKFDIPEDASVTVGKQRSDPDLIGTPEECVDQLSSLVSLFGPAEFVVHCVNDGLESQLRQYELLAEQCGMRGLEGDAL